MRQRNHKAESSDVAVIGMSCRFPGALNPAEFWDNLVQGRESISLIDPAEATSANPNYRKNPKFRAAAGTLTGIEEFDAGFFGYTDREAELMDPQQRLFLECAWEAFEDAGMDPFRATGSIGVYAGCGVNTYLINNIHPSRGYSCNRTFLESAEDLQVLLGNQADFLATRVSHKLDLRGPSINLQSACSTSLVAVHLACRSLIHGDCDVALAGCSTIRVPQDGGYLAEDGMVFSPDGHTRAFDAEANGTTFGSGVAAVLLKPLRTALADGDVVHAIIKGSAVNNDGGQKLGFTAPSVDGQAAAIRQALAQAQVEPSSVGYVEAHGTGTALGDPIEIAALMDAFGPLPARSCYLGSVKTNLGHLSWSAGMAGLIKAILALKYRKIPPTLHFSTPNPLANIEGSPFVVSSELVDWQVNDDLPLRAGVSAFGLGGTNAHVVLQEAPARREGTSAPGHHWHTITLSANSTEALAELRKSYARYLAQVPQASLADICYTTNTGRAHLPFRYAAAAASNEALERQLSSIDVKAATEQTGNGQRSPTCGKPIAFLFSGQGAQYAGMGRQLYESQVEFRTAMDRCDRALGSLGYNSILGIIYPTSPDDDRLNDVEYTQTALFSFEYSLAQMWMSWGICPTAVMGHSTGEYVAACIAGVFSLEDGLRLCAERGRLFKHKVPDAGLMATVGGSRRQVADAVANKEDQISIAAYNGPLSSVISGYSDAVRAACERLEALGANVSILNVQRAGHSPLTDCILDDLELVALETTFSKPHTLLISNVTGEISEFEVSTPEYWSKQTRAPVMFEQGMRTLSELGIETFLEIGPDSVLSGMGAYCLFSERPNSIPSLRRPLSACAPGEDWRNITTALSRLYMAGFNIDWSRVHGDHSYSRVSLPTYPFQREKHWISSPDSHPELERDGMTSEGGLLQLSWTELPENASTESNADGAWLVLGSDTDLTERLRDLLIGRGERCMTVHTDSSVNWDENGVSAADHSDQYKLLIDSLEIPLIGVIDLRACAPGSDARAQSGTAVMNSVSRWCKGLLSIARALACHGSKEEVRFVLVTRATQAVLPTDDVSGITCAPLWAIARILGIEHPEIRVQRIDLEAEPSLDDASELLASVLGSQDDDSIAIRNTRRFSARLTRSDASCTDSELSIDPDGSYLITGGLGGIGLVVAEWLAEMGARHLFLMGRRPPNDAAASALERIRANGTRLDVLTVDIADDAALEHAFSSTIDRTRLIGIFHAAGVIDDAVLAQQSADRLASVLRPKVLGAWNLHRLSSREGSEVRHFVLFSSAASLLGNAGQTAHAAANAFLDGLSHLRHTQNLPAVSINWGAWTEAGELSKNTLAREHVARIGFEPIPSKVGLAALASAMNQRNAQIGFCPMDWSTFLASSGLCRSEFFRNFRTTTSTGHDAPEFQFRELLAKSSPSERVDLLVRCVRDHARNIIGSQAGEHFSSPIDDHRPLSDYGLDSLSSIELRNSLQATVGQTVPAMLIVDCPTIHEISSRLAKLDFSTRSAPPQPLFLEGIQEPRRELSMQQRRWLSLVRSGYGARVVPILFETRLDEVAFRGALESVVSSHELLRYTFPNDCIEVLGTENVLQSNEPLYYDVSHLNREQRGAALSTAMKECWEQMPDPSDGASWKIRCLKYPNDRFLVLLSLQHIDFDGSSLTTFVSELRVAYRALMRGEAPPCSRVAQYRSYVEAQKAYMEHDILEDRAFFQGMYSSLLRTTTLPGHEGFDRNSVGESRRFSRVAPADLWRKIQNTAIANCVTPFSVMLCTYAKLLAEISGQNDVVIAMISNGRTDQRFGSTIGPFTAPFPVRVPVTTGDLSVIALQCHRAVAAITARSSYPVTDLVDNVPAFKGFPFDTYFTDASINFTNYRRDDDLEAPIARVIEILGPVTDADFLAANTTNLRQVTGLYLVIDINEDALRLNLWYQTRRFTERQASVWTNRMLDLLDEFTSSSGTE